MAKPLAERILVVGSTGSIGRAVISQLAERSATVRALTRDPNGAQLPRAIEVVAGDLTVPETLDTALRGVDKVFLVWTAPPSAIPAAMERITKNVRRVVFLSAPIKTQHPFFQQPNLARRIPEQIEPLIENSGVEWTFLRPGMLAANSLLWWGPQIRSGKTIRWPYLTVPTAPIDEYDIAAVAVRALKEEGHSGADYVLTGPQPLTQFEQISIIGDAVGRRFEVEEMTPEEDRRELIDIFPLYIVNMLLDAWGAAFGHPAHVTSTVEELTGTSARTFEMWVSRHISHFRSSPTMK